MRSWFVVLAVAFATLAAPRVRAADFCSSCEIQLGVGATYHYWGYTHSLVVPLAFNFGRDRWGSWELAAFRFPSRQNYYSTTFRWWVYYADPYWGGSLTRRLELFRYPHWRVILGLGAAYKSEENTLSASHWNFSEQLGVRLTPRPGLAIELIGRHWSNGGLKLPNHGQDFVTLMFTVYPSLLRAP
jgi:hypothetical protein